MGERSIDEKWLDQLIGAITDAKLEPVFERNGHYNGTLYAQTGLVTVVAIKYDFGAGAADFWVYGDDVPSHRTGHEGPWRVYLGPDYGQGRSWISPDGRIRGWAFVKLPYHDGRVLQKLLDFVNACMEGRSGADSDRQA